MLGSLPAGFDMSAMIRYLQPVLEWVWHGSVQASIMIVLIVAAILGVQKDAVLESGLRLLAAVVTAHAVGFFLGYVLGGLAGGFGNVARTISIEVGMQNSGLGAVLAQAHFANPLTAIPSALSAMTHCIIGSAVAAWWSRRSPV